MGGCLGTDVKSKYAAGEAVHSDSVIQADAEAKELATGTLSYCTWLILHIECRKLKDVDLLSKSDALGVLFERKEERWVETGRTEMITNTLDPKFATTFKVLYNFERLQRYKVVVIDVDKGQDPRTVNPTDCDFLGECEFSLGELVTAPGKKLVRNMVNRGGKAIPSLLVVLSEEASNCKEKFRIRLAATDLKNVERFGLPDPFLQISRQQEGGEFLPVYRTKMIKNTRSPTWDELFIRATQFNNGDMVRPLRLTVFDYQARGNHRPMGWCDVTTEQMQELAGKSGSVLPLHPPEGKPPEDYGSVKVLSFAVETSSSFLDYLAGGAEIGFVVAVDFTASNGDPAHISSKHYFAGGPTQYERAIMGIGGILEYYDKDKVFPCYGFGGQYQRNPTNHCFPLGTPPDSSCIGVQGLLQAYRHALANWSLSGPTLFAPVIRMAADMAQATVGVNPPKYTVLLILTDGAINDMDETVDIIIRASTLPLSILIVGIGTGPFGNMHVLDSDDCRLRNGSRTAVRDIVQFVEFDKYAGDGPRLAQELLAELPGQFLEYMRLNKIKCPRPTIAAPTMAAPSAPPLLPPATGGQ